MIHHVRDIDTAAREAIERLVGKPLGDDACVTIEVVHSTGDLKQPMTELPNHPAGRAVLPGWCDVYGGLSDKEIAQLEEAVLQRAQLSRALP